MKWQVACCRLQVSRRARPATLPALTIHNSPVTNHNWIVCLQIAEHFLRGLAVLPGLRGKALMTTRLTPRVLHGHDGDLLLGYHEMELTQMQPAEPTVAFFRSLGIHQAGGPRSRLRPRPTATTR